MGAAALGNLWDAFESLRYWWLQKRYAAGKTSRKLLEAHGLEFFIKNPEKCKLRRDFYVDKKSDHAMFLDPDGDSGKRGAGGFPSPEAALPKLNSGATSGIANESLDYFKFPLASAGLNDDDSSSRTGDAELFSDIDVPRGPMSPPVVGGVGVGRGRRRGPSQIRATPRQTASPRHKNPRGGMGPQPLAATGGRTPAGLPPSSAEVGTPLQPRRTGGFAELSVPGESDDLGESGRQGKTRKRLNIGKTSSGSPQMAQGGQTPSRAAALKLPFTESSSAQQLRAADAGRGPRARGTTGGRAGAPLVERWKKDPSAEGGATPGGDSSSPSTGRKKASSRSRAFTALQNSPTHIVKSF
eukprot:Hpha_TRINITY_DN16118_c1_g17::TRINITY_DN16118_c1_g17_i1::g.8222::m.8222